MKNTCFTVCYFRQLHQTNGTAAEMQTLAGTTLESRSLHHIYYEYLEMPVTVQVVLCLVQTPTKMQMVRDEQGVCGRTGI